MNSYIEIPPWMGTVVWQSTFCLALGLLAAARLRHRPARAHVVLLLAAVAAVLTPLGTAVIERTGWGMLAQHVTPTATNSSRPYLASQSQELLSPALQDRSGVSNRSAEPLWLADDPSRGESISVTPTGPRRVRLHYVWAATSAGVLSFILVGMLLESLRLRQTSSPLLDPSLQRAAQEAARCLDLPAPPALLGCQGVDSPMIWPWTRPPQLLLPTALLRSTEPIDWRSVMVHELAHATRRDHWSSLFGWLLVALLPWHPLAWWLRSRLMQEAEHACDDWALRSTNDVVRYADSLLHLTVQRRALLVMPAVRDHGKLRGRIVRILKDEQPNPAAGRTWLSGAVLSTLVLILAVSCAQPGEAPSSNARHANAPDTATRAVEITLLDEGKFDLGGLALSPDKAKLAGIDYMTDEAVVFDVATAERRVLTNGVVASGVVWSADGRRLAWAHVGDSNVTVQIFELEQEQLREFPVGSARSAYPTDWSRDGKRLLGKRILGNQGQLSAQIFVLDTTTGTYQDLLPSSGESWPVNMTPRLAPDGRTLVVEATAADGGSALHLRDLDGNWEYLYDQFEGRIGQPVWSPDSRWILFSGGDSEVDSIYGIAMSGREPLGAPILLHDNIGSKRFGSWTSKGDLTFQEWVNLGHLHILPVNPETGRPTGSARALPPAGRWAAGVTWTADSRHVVTLGASSFLMLSALDGRQLREIQVPEFVYIGRGFALAPDSRTLVVGTREADGRSGLSAIDMETGDVRFLFPFSGVPNRDAQWFADGESFVFTAQGELWIGNVQDGSYRQVTHRPEGARMSYNHPSLSPRFPNQIACKVDGAHPETGEQPYQAIVILDSEGKLLREVVRLEPRQGYFLGLTWSPNGRFIAYRHDRGGEDYTMWIAPVEGGEPWEVDLPPSVRVIWLPSWSPDGKSIAFRDLQSRQDYGWFDGLVPSR